MESGRSIASGVTVVVLLLCIFGGVSLAQAQAPAPAVDCFTNILNMTDCLSYVDAGSTRKTPEKGCCPALAGLIESSPVCLCQLLSNSSDYGFQINLNKAINLPKVCRINAPPFSLCSVIGVPVSIPTASEGPTAPAAGGPLPSSGPGAMTSPGGFNGASNSKDFALIVLAGLSSFAVTIFL